MSAAVGQLTISGLFSLFEVEYEAEETVDLEDESLYTWDEA